MSSNQAGSGHTEMLRIQAALDSLAESDMPHQNRVLWVARFLTHLTHGIGCSIYLKDDSGRLTPFSDFHTPETSHLWEKTKPFLQEMAQRSADAGVAGTAEWPVQENSDRIVHFLTARLGRLGGKQGAAGLAILLGPNDSIEPVLILFQVAASCLSGMEPFSTKTATATQNNPIAENAWKQLDAGWKGGLDFDACVHGLINFIGEKTGCDRIFLGRRTWLRHGKIVASSDGSHLRASQSSVTTMRSALSEAFMLPKATASKDEEGDPVFLRHALNEWKAEAALAVPLGAKEGKTAHGAALFFWGRGKAPTEETVRMIESRVEAASILLDIFYRAKKAWLYRWGERMLTRLRHDRKFAWTVAGACAFILGIPLPHPIWVKAKVEPEVRRVVAAPFDSLLKKSHLRPGDRVEENQLMALLDERELRWRFDEVSAARDRALKQRDKSLTLSDGENDPVELQMATLEAEGHDVECRQVEYKLKNLEIRAPISGVVLSGDLARAEGVPLRQGQPLFEIAPLEKMFAELEVDENDISHVRKGDFVFARFNAFPGRQWPGRISRIQPESVQRDGRHALVAEAPFESERAGEIGLRPGMKGSAVIMAGWKPIFWLLFHRVWEFIFNLGS